MTHVRRHTRQTATGKTATVRAHERDTGDGMRPAPDWATPARPEDFGPIAPTVWDDEEEPAGDWWADDVCPECWHEGCDGDCESLQERTDRIRREQVAASAKGDVETWITTLAENDAEYGRDSKDNPNNKPNGKWR